MANVRDLRIFSAEQIEVPDDFPKVLKNFTKEVIRIAPENIISFSRTYFEQILQSRGYFEKHQREKIEVLPSSFFSQRVEDISEFYEMGQEIESGLYEAVSKHSGIRRAIKMVEKQTPGSSGSVQKRIDLMKEVDHPNVSRVIEVFEDSGSYFLVFEFFSNTTLSTVIIDSHRLDEGTTAEIMADLLSIVVYLHSNNICHRDLKLENILYDKKRTNKCVKLFEFSSATKYSAEKNLTETIGTAYCIAPEVIKGTYSSKVDEWSLGVLMYIMLSGAPPFDGETDRDILKNVKEGRYNFDIFSEIPTPVSEEAKDLVSRLMRIDPESRITAEDALQHPWFSKFQNPVVRYANEIEIEKCLNSIQTFNAGDKIK